RMLVMHHGRMLEQGPTKDVFTGPQRHQTRAMLAAATRLDQPPPPPPPQSPAPRLCVDGLSVSYDVPGRWKRTMPKGAVNDVSFSLFAAETLAVVGESGCGKSSLAKAVAGLVAAGKGSVRLAGRQLAARVQERSISERRSLQMVFQDPVASLSPAMKVGNIIAETLALHEPGLTRA